MKEKKKYLLQAHYMHKCAHQRDAKFTRLRAKLHMHTGALNVRAKGSRYSHE